jgi:cytoskeletal protein CcmA (bactofilin family)
MPNVKGNINTNSDVCTINSGTVHGNINAIGNVVITGGTVNNVYTNGNVIISGGTINGNIYAFGTVTITNWPAINGTVNLDGNLINSTVNLTGKVFYGKVTQIQPVQLTPITVNTDATDTYISTKAQMDAQRTSMASCVFAIDVMSKTSLPNCYTYLNGDYIINKNCSFSIKPYTNNWTVGPIILIDASSQDIYITLKSYDGSNNFKLGDGICILTRDTSGRHHKVYLCTDDGNGNYVNFSLANSNSTGVFLGNEQYYLNRTDETPNLYMISTYKPTGTQPVQTISFAGNAGTLYGYIFAPYASVNMSVSGTCANKTMPALCGAVIGSNISFSTFWTYQYKDPNAGTDSGSSGSGTLSWLGTDCKVIGTYVG